MDYQTLLEYMTATQARILCRTKEQRAEVVNILKDINPVLNPSYIGQEFNASDFPYIGYDALTNFWALWRYLDTNKVLTVEELRDLVYDHADEVELSCDSLEGVL